MSVPLTKVDSAIAGLSIDDKAPKPSEKEVKKTHKRTPSKSGEVWNINDLGKSPSPPSIHPSFHHRSSSLFIQRSKRSSCHSQLRHKRLGGKSLACRVHIIYHLTPPARKLNTSPNTVEDRDILKLHLVNPPVKKIDLHFPLGLEVTARNLKGVTIKDALDAIHKQFKKKVSGLADHPKQG